MIQYACCRPIVSPSDAHSFGITAPPAIPTINKAEAVFVNLPKPLMANGQIAGHTNALAKPRMAIKNTEVNPEVKMAAIENTIPSIAENINAVDWDKYLGIVKMPIR